MVAAGNKAKCLSSVNHTTRTIHHHHHHQKLCLVLSKRVQATLSRKKILFNVVLTLLGQHCTGKTLYNVVQDTPDNIVHEKILLNVVVILLG